MNKYTYIVHPYLPRTETHMSLYHSVLPTKLLSDQKFCLPVVCVLLRPEIMQVLQSTDFLHDPELNIFISVSSGYLYSLPAQQK